MNAINRNGIVTIKDLFKLKKFKKLLDPSENIININPNKNIILLNLEKLICVFDLIAKHPPTNAAKII